MSRFDCVVFDLDGTLVDSAPDLHAAANAMLAELNRPALTLAEVTGFIGNGVPTLVERCLDATGGADGMVPDALARYRRHYDADPARLTRPWPGAIEAVRGLRAAGCRLGICTNKPEGPARRLIALLGLEALFGCVTGGDTTPAHKPDPEVLWHCIRALRATPARTLYVGDSETDAATAANAGVTFALYTRGYRKMSVESLAPAFAFEDWPALGGFVMAGAAPGENAERATPRPT